MARETLGGVQNLFSDVSVADSGVKTRKRKTIESGSLVQSVDEDVLKQAIVEAKEYPKLSIYSPRIMAVFRYLQLTIPRYGMSAEAAQLLEQAVAQKYPKLYAEVSNKMDIAQK